MVATFLLVVFCRSILFAKADPNDNAKSQSYLDAQLIKAIESLDANTVKAVLDSGANPNSIYGSQAWGRSAIQLAAMLGTIKDGSDEKDSLQILKIIFDYDAKLQRCDRQILFFPITDDRAQVTDFLIRKGVSPTTIIEGMTPIEWAEAYRSKSVVDVLLKHGAKPVSPKEAAQLHFIHSAGRSFEKTARFEQKNIIEMEKALEDGATVNGKNSKGETALSEATGNVLTLEDYTTVIYLLQKGANPNLESKKSFGGLAGIPLHNAVAFMSYIFNRNEGRDDEVYSKLIVEALLKSGAHVSSRGDNSQTPLHIASKNNGLVAAEMLIKAGAKIMDKDDTGKTPLDYAESAEMIKLLKSHGAKEL